MSEASFLSGYSAFSLKLPSPVGEGASPRLIAEFTLGADIRELAPYINAVAQKAVFHQKPPHIRFVLDSILCTLFENRGSASSFCDRNQALDFLEKLLIFLNRIHLNRDSIRPNYKTQDAMPVLNLFRILPGSNCGQCGFASCMAFAVALSRQRAGISGCPGLSRPSSLRAVYPVLDAKGRLISTVAIDVDSAFRQASSPGGPAPAGNSGKKPDTPATTLAGLFTQTGNDDLPARLTRRELGVLRLMARGATNLDISNSLHISPHTVKSHIIHIFNKLGVSDRTRASVWAVRHKLV
ncbi:MAG: LuxR C-terminal-related transcriptional regulator [Syntrophobacteraceae bacterium]|nr:LuxR C-terminal-related transcriptional regulator [Syntrophobacteraceae bacterium]